MFEHALVCECFTKFDCKTIGFKKESKQIDLNWFEDNIKKLKEEYNCIIVIRQTINEVINK